METVPEILSLRPRKLVLCKIPLERLYPFRKLLQIKLLGTAFFFGVQFTIFTSFSQGGNSWFSLRVTFSFYQRKLTIKDGTVIALRLVIPFQLNKMCL